MTYRYVRHDDVMLYCLCGWMWAADLGPPHNEYSTLMCWPCQCRCREPK
jgi:hypothetical protein